MAKYELLNNQDHQDIKVITDHSAEYGDAVMSAMTFPFEFRAAQSCYPILLQKDMQTGQLYPVALFGFQERENLFLDEHGWDAAYIPIMIKRHPFLIGFQAAQNGGGQSRQPVVSIDIDNPRVNTERGEALFQQFGGRTDFLEQVTAMLDTIHRGHELNKEFAQALVDQDLVESVTLGITLDDGSDNQLVGFYTINEERLQQLDDAIVVALHRKGFLQAVYMMLASFGRVGELVRRKNSGLATA